MFLMTEFGVTFVILIE